MTTRPLEGASESTDLVSAFAEKARAYCDHLAREGITFVPYRDPSLPMFRALPRELRLAILADLDGSLSLFEEAVAAGESLRDSPRLVWRALARQGLAPGSDAFDGITDGDIVEVYGTDFRQIFRNLEFVRWISFSLEEMVSLPWNELVESDPAIFAYWQELAAKVMRGEITRGFVPKVQAYRCREKLGERQAFDVQLKWFAPVYRDGQMAGLIAVNRTTRAD